LTVVATLLILAKLFRAGIRALRRRAIYHTW